MNEQSTKTGFGTPTITRFQGGRIGAISLEFDDNMVSQRENALPLLAERQLVGTFFVNPGKPSYEQQQETWEKTVISTGHEVGNHTFTHRGATNAEEAETEIRLSSEVLTRVYGSRPRLLPFARPGGVRWEVTPDEIAAILTRHRLFALSVRKIMADDRGEADPRAFPDQAIHEGIWVSVCLHGVGGEWISTSIPKFTRLLDYLVKQRALVWTATAGAIYKYATARDAAHMPVLSDISSTGFAVRVECDVQKLNTYGLPISDLYDEPLTIELSVPDAWHSVRISAQGEHPAGTANTFRYNGQNRLRFEVLPNTKPIRVERVS